MSLTSRLLKNLPGFVFLRDKNLKSQYCNPAYAAYLGLSDTEEFIGLNYNEAPNPHVADYAEKYDTHDKQVINQVKTINVLSIDKVSQNDPIIMHGCKVPLINDEGQVEGLLGQALQLQKNYLAHLQKLLQLENQNLVKTIFEINNYNDYGLSPRESECYFYLLRGLTAKIIGNKLALSPKTVEFYLTNVRQKLNCATKTELIEKGFDLGLHYIIPNHLLSSVKSVN